MKIEIVTENPKCGKIIYVDPTKPSPCQGSILLVDENAYSKVYRCTACEHLTKR